MSQKLYKVEDIQLLFKELKVEIKKLKCFIEECCSKIPINIGTGVGLFKRLNTQNKWEFKSIKEGSNISITSTDTEIVISATAEPFNCDDLNNCQIITDIEQDLSNKWNLDGNVTTSSNFIGSLNDQPVIIKSNNQIVSELYTTSINVGINNAPQDNSIKIGSNITSGDSQIVSIGFNSNAGSNGVAIGFQAIAQNNSVALGANSTTIANQFSLADSILYAKWRGIPYEFPSSQGAASTVLTNNGAGVLSWQTNGAGSVTSVGLTMPTAFSVANSPITGSGTLAVTATGNASQYIRGDGVLGILPENSGGAGGVVYYFNGNTASSIAGSFEMSKTPDTGVPANFSKTGDGLIASFATNAGDPNITEIPTGIWLFKPYLSMATNVGSPKINTQVKIFDGIGYTTIATSDTFLVSNGTATSLYTFGIVIPQTTITVTDRIVVEFYLSNSLGDTITLYTEDSFINSVSTTIPSGIATLNGLNTTTQHLATGTTGTDFNISSATNTHTFNIPTASATNRGLLSTADWSTFNGKQNDLGFTPENVANKQDNLATDGTGTKYPTVDAINVALSLLSFNPSKVVYYDDFVCFMGNTTANFSSTSHSAFLSLGTGARISTMIAPFSDATGVLQCETQTGSTSSGLVGAFDMGIRCASGEITYTARWRTETLSDGTNRYDIYAGLGVRTSYLANGTIAFVYSDNINSGKFQLYRKNTAGTIATDDSGITVNAGQWYILKIVVNAAGTSAEFFIDGVSVGAFGGLPNSTASLGAIYGFRKSIGTANRNTYLDYQLASQDLNFSR